MQQLAAKKAESLARQEQVQTAASIGVSPNKAMGSPSPAKPARLAAHTSSRNTEVGGSSTFVNSRKASRTNSKKRM